MGIKLKVDEYRFEPVTTAGSANSSEHQLLAAYSNLTFIAHNPLGGSGTAVASIQASPDNGSTWVTLDSTIALGAGAHDKKEFDPPCGLVRMRVVASAGTPTIYGSVFGARDKDIKAPPQRAVSGRVALGAGSASPEVTLDRGAKRVRLYAVWVGGTGTVIFQGSFNGTNYFTLSGTLSMSSAAPCHQVTLNDYLIRQFKATFTQTTGTFEAYMVAEGLNEEP